ncbi:MAG TPA: response regulator [Candidatus Deferrimicrobium sp.]|nr:response regulator [Candidatus Kapabacteria bacterium]HLP59500.1 response regulator [Candidatus Deferrimicrobium sp.]
MITKKATMNIETHSKKGLVLVVEDEPIMRKIAKKVLVDEGYDVLTAENGERGIAQFRLHYNHIVLVLLDMVLPDQSGKDVYIEMKKINPLVKVLLNSGYRHDRRLAEAFELGIKHFIEKPYTLEKLSTAIHRAIESP